MLAVFGPKKPIICERKYWIATARIVYLRAIKLNSLNVRTAFGVPVHVEMWSSSRSPSPLAEPGTNHTHFNPARTRSLYIFHPPHFLFFSCIFVVGVCARVTFLIDFTFSQWIDYISGNCEKRWAPSKRSDHTMRTCIDDEVIAMDERQHFKFNYNNENSIDARD